jgi:hypothetical protein
MREPPSLDGLRKVAGQPRGGPATARPRKPSASAGLGAAAEGGAAAYSAREDVLRRIQASVRGREKEIGGSGGALVEPPRPLGEF